MSTFIKNQKNLIDKVAASLSFVCLIHCLLVPSYFVFLLSASINNEWVHLTILALSVPISLFALTSGLRNHKNIRIFMVGIVGLATMICGLLFGEQFELLLTAIGAILVLTAHFFNYRTCQKLDCEQCHTAKS